MDADTKHGASMPIHAQPLPIEGPASNIPPVMQISEDILTSIFFHILANHLSTATPAPNVFKGSPAALVSHVCKAWRELSLATPMLWSSIQLSLLRYPKMQETIDDYQRDKRRWHIKMKSAHDALQAWLPRSGDCPLSVVLSGFEEFDTTNEKACSEVNSLLLTLGNVAPRWKDVHICLGPSWNTNVERVCSLPQLSAASVPLLRSLTVEGSATTQPPVTAQQGEPEIHVPLAILGAPSLRSLSLGPTCHYPLGGLPVNWSNLCHLTIQGYEFPLKESATPRAVLCPFETLMLLKSCPNLLTADVAIEYPDLLTSPEYSSSKATLSNLHSLTIRFTIPDREFISTLSLPSLRILRFFDIPAPRPTTELSATDIPPMARWIRAYGAQLEEIHFPYDTLATEHVLEECMEHIRDVKVLGLGKDTQVGGVGEWGPMIEDPEQPLREAWQSSLSDLLLEHLTPAFDESDYGGQILRRPCWCPHLQKLSFTLAGESPKHSNADVVRRAARLVGGRRKRAAGIALLENVTFTTDFAKVRGTSILQGLVLDSVDLEDLKLEMRYGAISDKAMSRPRNRVYMSTTQTISTRPDV
ncbi:hypothetical protein DFP72DRAFT_902118 [Ephemerocybe angulata]|uniref:F-box domain-containing protein n=1 Tax=Ephemerocybe angulata TaxID=980116 RepID=A0A8H6HTY6_9AGAR|nr:hypothetical protein DFP72DRAFT_902118 [Tulosesus angulatus]